MFIFLSLFIFFVFSCPCSAQAKSEAPTPITVGDLEKYQNFNGKERRHFLFDFYMKNKKNGVTDVDIFNELLKLDVKDGQNSDVVKNLSLLGARYRDIKDFVKSAIDELNIEILSKNPGRTDFLIDIDDPETWKNIKHFQIGNRTVEDYIKLFKNSNYFSDVVTTENFSAVLASCADMEKDKIYMSFILFPRNGAVFLSQREGESDAGIKIDFSGAENIEFDPIRFPFEKQFNINGGKAFGYEGNVYLPFTAKLTDGKKAGYVKAVVSAETCKDSLCRMETTGVINYKTKKAELESSNCAKIKQQFFAAPLSQGGGLELKKAFFEKDENGEINLFATIDIPAVGAKDPTVIIKNKQGLFFSDAFISWDGDDMLLKFRLLNPEKFQGEANVTIDIGYTGRASEFTTSVKLENAWKSSSFSFFSFSILDCLLAFLLGVKFLFLTPVLSAFLMLGYQAAIVDRKTSAKTIAFYNGLGNMFYFWCAVYLICGLICAYLLPEDIFWGMQFLSPMINFLFFVVFFCLIFFTPKVFDNVAIILISERFKKLFSVFGAEDVREKAGLIVGFIIGLLLFITPLTGMYYDIYVLLSRSVIVYSVAFVAGVSLPILILSLCDKQAAAFSVDDRTRKRVGLILPLPLILQAVLLAVLVWSQAGLGALGILSVLAVLITLCLKIAPTSKKLPIFIAIVCVGLVSIPFYPNENDLNRKGGILFDAELLYSRMKEGKSVYVNVTESFCLSCQWNRMIMITQGAAKEIERGDLTVMRIGYKDPFIKRLLSQGREYRLPINLMFSSLYPEGKVIDSVLNPWIAQEITVKNVTPKENEPDPQNVQTESQPTPAAKGID